MKAILFDFDGTIANTIPAIREGVNNTMLRYGYPTHSDAEVLTFIKHGPRELIRQAITESVRSAEQIDRVLADYNTEYGKVYDHTREAYAGMAELLDRLHREGYRIGVLSNKQDEFVKKLSEQVLLPHSYDAARGVRPGEPTKPDPLMPTELAKALKAPLSECVMVGDSDVDIETAKNAGMAHIGVGWGYRDEPFLRAHGATRIAHTPEEIETILKTM